MPLLVGEVRSTTRCPTAPVPVEKTTCAKSSPAPSGRRSRRRRRGARPAPPARYEARSRSCTPRLTRTPHPQGRVGPIRRSSMPVTSPGRTRPASARTTGLKRSEWPTKRCARRRAAAAAARASADGAADRLLDEDVPPGAERARDDVGVRVDRRRDDHDLGGRDGRRLGREPRDACRRGRVGGDVVHAGHVEAALEPAHHAHVAEAHRTEADHGHPVPSNRACPRAQGPLQCHARRPTARRKRTAPLAADAERERVRRLRDAVARREVPRPDLA